MKKNEITIGAIYSAKVSGRIVPVKIVKVNPHGGWDAVNLTTKKSVRIKSAQRLRRRVSDPKAPKAKSATGAKRAAKATTKAKTPKQRHTGQRGATSGDTGGTKPMSCLGAAVQVLKERDHADGPLSCVQMIERMVAKGYWKPRKGGKTPANTLSSAILRETRDKGEASRFEKVQRGKFTLSLKR